MFHRVKSASQNQEIQNTNEPQQGDLEQAVQKSEREKEVKAVEIVEDVVIVEEQPEASASAQEESGAQLNIPEDEESEAPMPPQSAYAPGTYTNYGQHAAAAQQEPVQQDNTQIYQAPQMDDTQNRLLIGAGITISGEIEACNTLVVEGTVEASLKGARVVEIEESGTFYGAIEIEEATIAGRFEGELVVNGRLSVTSTGVITGAIAYKELEIEAGALIDGRLNPIREGAQAQATKPRHTQKKKTAPSRKTQQPANELFPPQQGNAAAE